MALRVLLVAVACLACAEAFSPAATLRRTPGGSVAARSSAFTPQPRPLVAQPQSTTPGVQMSLFGLGWPELLVIGGAALLFFGPDKLTDAAKEAGKSAGALKEASAAFQEGLKEADKDAKEETAKLKESKED